MRVCSFYWDVYIAGWPYSVTLAWFTLRLYLRQPGQLRHFQVVYAFLVGCALWLGGVDVVLTPQRLGGRARWGGQVFVGLALLGSVLVFPGIGGWLFLNWVG